MAVPGEQESFKSQSFSSPKKTTGASSPFASGQSGAAGSQAAKREVARAQYFDNRSDITADRLDRRIKQAREYEAFKSDPTKTKLAGGTTNLYQAATPGGITLADKQIQLANKYGPTFSEIMSDVTYAGGKVLGALGERAMSGGLGFLGAIKEVANYALNKANQGYDKLNPVQQEIFDNPDKYPYASKVPQVEAVNNSRLLALEANNDALGLKALEERMKLLENYKRREAFKEDIETDLLPSMAAEVEPIVTTAPTEDLRGEYVPPVAYEVTAPIDVKEKFNTAAENYLDPEAREAALEELKKDERIKANEGKSELSLLEALNPFDDIPTGIALNELINPDAQDISQFKKEMDQGFIEDKPFLSKTDGTQVTAYNNPGNLQFAGQEGAIEGQTYGNNFAVFPSAEAGITALRNDLTAKVSRSNKVDDIIGEYAPKADNPESFNNYVEFVKNTVGETVEPNELDDLTRSVIQFENKPSIANQYLTMVADGGMIDKQLKSLQNGLQNMYNGIPSVKRR